MCPHCSPDPDSPKYDEYCQQKMMLYKPFRQVEELLDEHDTFVAVYADFLQSGNVPPSLEEDIHRLEQNTQQSSEDDDNAQVCLHLPINIIAHVIIANCTLFKSLFSIHNYRNKTKIPSNQSEQLRSGCWSVSAVLTSNKISAVNLK